jgi:hypothetical protein
MKAIPMKKLIMVAVVLFGWPFLAAAESDSSSAAELLGFSDSSAAPVTEAAEPIDLETATADNLLDAVKLAKLKLEQERQKRLGIWGGQPPSYSEFPARAEIILAIWRQDVGVVNLYLADKQGRNLWVKSPGAPPVSVSYHARLYSRYYIWPGHQATVVGVLYPYMEERGGRFHTKEVVYVPTTSAMRTPELLTAGSDYLSYLVRDAFAELKKRQVKSRAFPGQLLADVIDPYLIKSVVVIEHSDHRTLLSENDPESVLGRFYVDLAVNQDNAFAYAESHAGALGLAQFMPSTYALFVRNRPDIGLIPDFQNGMADHQNAVMAEAAYFDDTLALLPEEIRSDYLANPALAADFLAAAYNGGISRVRKAYANFGEAWDQSHNSYYSLRMETVWYVAKLRKVYAMLTSGVYATPTAPSNTLPDGATLASQTHAIPAPAPTVPISDTTAPVSSTVVPISLSQIDPISTICFGDGSCVSVD